MKKALLFGSIGAIMETSDIQRRAYNQAMHEAGLPWIWHRDVYADLLEQSGGKDRLAMLAAATGFTLSKAQIDAIHSRKMDIACTEIITTKVAPRSGVVALAHMAKDRGIKLGFVTTTYQPNIDAIFAAMGDILSPQDFDHIVDRDAVENGKPSPDAYLAALTALGVSPGEALAIEDTALSVMSAKRADIDTIATPGEISAGQDFWQADIIMPSLADSDGLIDKRALAMLGWKVTELTAAAISEIIEMALSDHTSFAQITAQYGIDADGVKALMRSNLKPGSYRAWRKRVRDFADRLEHYK